MNLPKQIVPASIAVGLDTGTDPKLVAQGMLRLDDLEVARGGVLRCRNGHANIDEAGGNITAPHLASYKGVPCAIEHAVQRTEGSALSSSLWKTAGTIELWDVDDETVTVAEGTQRYHVEVVEVGSIVCWAYILPNVDAVHYDLWVETYNRYSGRLLYKTALLTTHVNSGIMPRLALSTDRLRLYVVYVTSSLIWRANIDITSGAIGAGANTDIPVDDGSPIDACFVSPTVCIVACGAGSGDFILGYFTTAGVYGHAHTSPFDVHAVGCWKRYGSAEAVVAFYNLTDKTVYLCCVDTALSFTTSPFAMRVVTGDSCKSITGYSDSANNTWVVLTERCATGWGSDIRKAQVTLNTSTVVSDAWIHNKAMLASKCWWDNSQLYFWVTDTATSTAFLLDGGGNTRGKALVEEAKTYESTAPVASNFISSATTREGTTIRTITALRRLSPVVPSVSGAYATVYPVAVSAGRPVRLQCIEAQDVLLIPGSMPCLFDGVNIVEQGFTTIPESPVVSGTSSGGLTAGTYYCTITYRSRDAAGRLHESAPAIPVAVTLTAGQKIAWTIPTLTHTLKSDVLICLWRTKCNKQQLVLLTTYVNDKTIYAITGFVDGVADSFLTGAEDLYTNAYPTQVLENNAPPQHHIQCLHQGRHFVVDDENKGVRVCYSKPLRDRLGIEHSEYLTLTVPPDGGDITAICSHMDRLVVFKGSCAYYFSGEGLDDLGQGLNYSGPFLLSEGKGCQHSKALCAIDDGIFFCAADRVYLLTKQMDVNDIGKPVRYYTDPTSSGKLTPKVALHQPTKNRVAVFTDGRALVFDTLYRVWTAWSNHAATDACLAGETLVHHVLSGFARAQSTDWRDEAVPVVPYIESGHYRVGGIGGLQRIDRLLVYAYCRGDSTLNCAFQYDDDPYWRDAQTLAMAAFQHWGEEAYFGAGSDVALADSAAIADFEVGRDQCGSLRVRLYPSAHTGLVQPFEIAGLAFRAVGKGKLTLVGGARESS